MESNDHSFSQICNEYFNRFANKDTEGLANMFSENITLRDWEQTAEGKEALLTSLDKLFNAVKQIDIRVISQYSKGDTVISELEIFIDDSRDGLKVVDIIDFDSDKKIKCIRAYRG